MNFNSVIKPHLIESIRTLNPIENKELLTLMFKEWLSEEELLNDIVNTPSMMEVWKEIIDENYEKFKHKFKL